MIRPTIEKIDEIIDKLKELQTTIATIKDKPLEFPESQENNNKSLSIDQLINAVGQKSAGESIDTLKQVLQKSLIDGFSSYPQNSNQATTQVLAMLPSLSQSRLKKLLKDDIPQLLADDRISKVKKQVWHGESPFTEEAQNLHFIQKEIDKQIQINIEAAKERRWNKHTQPLRDEIEILLSPYGDFLQKYITLDVKDLLSSGNTSPLGRVIHEFEKIRYRVKTEAEQSAPQKPAGTGQKDMDKNKDQDRQLFSQIAIDVREHPDKYRNAGEWLDKYWGEKRQVSQLVRFNEARQDLLKKYEKQDFIPEDDAIRILLITWLLTDADAQKTNPNITQFAGWSWKPTDDITSGSRCAASSLWCKNAYGYDCWMRLVRIAWKTVDTQKPAETGRNTTPDKRCGIWTLVKRIPRWIYVLVIFLAALLTIFHLLGWL